MAGKRGELETWRDSVKSVELCQSVLPYSSASRMIENCSCSSSCREGVGVSAEGVFCVLSPANPANIIFPHHRSPTFAHSLAPPPPKTAPPPLTTLPPNQRCCTTQPHRPPPHRATIIPDCVQLHFIPRFSSTLSSMTFSARP